MLVSGKCLFDIEFCFEFFVFEILWQTKIIMQNRSCFLVAVSSLEFGGKYSQINIIRLFIRP